MHGSGSSESSYHPKKKQSKNNPEKVYPAIAFVWKSICLITES